jgi:hypothetical protein
MSLVTVGWFDSISFMPALPAARARSQARGLAYAR